MNPYEILGLSKTATPAEIRRAFRKAATVNHPDKGGDAAKMAGINAAYEVLSNPERREQYDQTGETEQKQSLRSEALHRVVMFVHLAAEAGAMDIVGHTLTLVEAEIAKAKSGIQSARAARATFEQQLQRVRRKPSAVEREPEGDFVSQILKTRIADADAHVSKMDDLIATLNEAKVILDDYEYGEGPGDLAALLASMHWRTS